MDLGTVAATLKRLSGINRKYAMIAGAVVVFVACLGFLRMPSPKLANLSRPKLILTATEDSAVKGKKPVTRPGAPAGVGGANAAAGGPAFAPKSPADRRQAVQQRRDEMMKRRQAAIANQGAAGTEGPAVVPPVNQLNRLGPHTPPITAGAGAAPGAGAAAPVGRAAGIGHSAPPAPANPNEPDSAPDEEGSDAAIQ